MRAADAAERFRKRDCRHNKPGTFIESTQPTLQPSSMAVTVPIEEGITQDAGYIYPSEAGRTEVEAENSCGRKWAGFILCFADAAAAGIAVFGLRQTAPILGPDGVSMLAAVGGDGIFRSAEPGLNLWTSTLEILTTYGSILTGFVILFAVRELWGWIRAKCLLSWCLTHRAANHFPKPQLSLLVFVGWIILALSGIGYHLIWFENYRTISEIPFWGFLAATVFGFLCLWKYGADLDHFKNQLNNYRQGLPVTIGDGTFSHPRRKPSF